VAGRGRRRWLFADKRNGIGLDTALGIDLEFIGDNFVFLRSALPVGKRAYVYEDSLATAIGCNETEAFVILP